MIKYFRHIAIILVGILSTLPTFSYDFEVDGLCYNKLSDKEVEVTYKNADGNSYSGNLTIPSSVTYNGSTYTVTAIGSHAFEYCSKLTGALTIPSSVTSIGDFAFSGCYNLTGSLTIPSSVTSIGDYAFSGCSRLTGSLTIPSSVKSIGKLAFFACSGFTGSLTISNSVTSISEGTFNNCSGLSGSLIIPSSVTSIGDGAFYNCSGLTGSLIIPSSVTSIGNNAFDSCSGFTGSLIIPSSVTSIGNNAFMFCSGFNSLTIPSSVKSIEFRAFSDCKRLSIVESCIESPFKISEGVFQDISSNAVLQVPKGTKGKYEAYTGWTKNFCKIVEEGESVNQDELLYSIEIDGLCYDLNITKNTATVTYKKYEGDSYSGSLSIPSSVTYNGSTYAVSAIGPRAFYYCSKLKGSLTIPNSVTSIGNSAFDHCRGFTGPLIIPNSVLSIGKLAFWYCSGFNGTLTLSNSIMSIEEQAFDGCSGFTGSLIIPNSVSSIGQGAFKGCIGFDSLTIPSSVKSIEFRAFSDCKRLSMVESWIDSPFYISEGVFQDISPNAVLQVPKGTKGKYESYVGWTNNFSKIVEEGDFINQDELLYGIEINGLCYDLNITKKTATVTYKNYEGDSYSGSLSIPSSVTYNGSTYTVTAIGSLAFFNCSGLTGSLIIPSSVTSIGDSAFSGCYNLTGSLTIPSSVTSIGNYAFSSCRGFTGSLIIQNSKNSKLSIGSDAFRSCSGFDSLTVPNSVISIGYRAFISCKQLSMVESWIDSPFYIQEDVFQDIASNAVLQVPNGTKNKYEAYTGWTKNFSKIVEAGSSTTTYELSITASGNGSVSYDGKTIRNNTSTFTVNEDASATISFNPDNGYKIKSVKVNSSDVTSNLSNNKYSISNINKNTTVEVVFQEDTNKFIINGVNYTIISYDNNTINLANGNYGIVLEVPATITYQGVTWSVAGIDNNALANNEELAAIIWNPSIAFTSSVYNPNLLLYVKSASYAPATIKNVVVNSTAESIVLTDAASGNNFYCPKEFTAKKISYSHNYKMSTGLGECRGWETIALPFDVQKITHSSRGELTPFENWKNRDNKKPFWLMSYGTGGWNNANSIKANTPYVISMPNNSEYKAEFRLNGIVTFSSENVTINKSDNMQTGSYDGNTFTPNFIVTNNSEYKALNVENDYETYDKNDPAEGSKFGEIQRTIHPFEAYMTTVNKARKTISIDGDMTTGIEEMFVLMDENKELRIYNLKGQLMKVDQNKGIEEVKSSLPAGVYIVKGKKLIIK